MVVPLLDEEENVAGIVERFDVIRQMYPEYDFELVAVDDGSTDGTLEALRRHITNRADGTIVVLSRNFGSHAAITAGLSTLSGDCAIVVGGDLQEPADLVGRLLAEWESGYDVVWGVRDQRVDQRAVGRVLSSWFTKLFTHISDLDNYPTEGPSGVLCSRQVVDVVIDMKERNRNVLGLMAWSGFRQCSIQYRQRARAAGESKWSTKKRLKLAIDSFAQFSFAPVRAMTYSGLVIASLGFLYALFLVGRRVFSAPPLEGWTTVVVLVLILGGMQLVMLGVLGEYLWRGVDEARARPLYVIRETVRSGAISESAAGDDELRGGS